MKKAVCQSRLALDYLLAQEGGICGKFNLSSCYLKIDDNSKVIEEASLPGSKNWVMSPSKSAKDGLQILCGKAGSQLLESSKL